LGIQRVSPISLGETVESPIFNGSIPAIS
jgi:hypothetical protein